MTATTATDSSLPIQYYFEETTEAGHDSIWQANPFYTDSGLDPETQYTYRVQTRDTTNPPNVGDWSTPPASATTDEIPTGECPDVDLDDDCDCDIDDLVIFVAQWLDPNGCPGHPEDCADIDEDNDGVDGEDFAVLAADWQETGASTILVINEVMSNNDTTIQDEYSQYDDWIEIYNAGILPVNMAGMVLQDSQPNPTSWEIPSGVTINVGEYKLFWADEETWQGNNHTNFALRASGDSVTLYDTDGQTILDTVTFGELSDDISYGRWPDKTGDFMNMNDPTPGLANTVGMAGEVYFSRPGGTFTTNFSLGLTTKSPTATIYYTKNGDEPTDIVSPDNLLYSSPFTITSTTWVRAIAYDSPLDHSPITSRAYTKLHANVQTLQSNLPIVIVHSFDTNIDTVGRDFHQVIATFIETDEVTGTCSITDSAQWTGLGGMHRRGNSTYGWEKAQYRFETWDENSPDTDPYSTAEYMDMDVSLLGFSAESDWIIHAPYADRTLMRNYQMYTWSRQIGRYAVRTRFVELYRDFNMDYIVSDADYRGVYIFMEKIKRGRDRVDIERLRPSHTSEPEITGGYMFKKDWDSDFTTAIYDEPLQYEDPRYEELNSTQRNWIQNYFNQFDTALSSGDYDNPAHPNYYGNYIDIGSWIDHHILVEIAKNVDGFILSTFLYKDRGGKINMGPIWDYNGSLGADYFCSYDPEGWFHEYDETCINDCAGELATFPNEDNPDAYNWYYRLFEDSEFLLAYADNWFALREHHFKAGNLHADIDNAVAYLTTDVAGESAVDRNFTKWDNLEEDLWPDFLDNIFNPDPCEPHPHPNCDHGYPPTYAGYVQWIKDWLELRVAWMDSEIDSSYGDFPSVIKVNSVNKNRGDHISSTDSISMTGGGTIYYTTDGSDPRLHGGATAGSASAYGSAFTLSGTKQIKARIRYASDNWSALNEATFAVGPVADNLRITEIMYNVNDPNHEYIELKNIGGTAFDLNLVKFTDGIDFTFPSRSLGPNQYVLVVRNETSFIEHYGSGLSGTIAGEFIGAINNAGERIELQDALGQTILNFRFKDGWYPITDGDDFSLNIIDPNNSDPNSWEYAEYWQPSSVAGGTPAAGDTGHVALPGAIVINEVMTHTNSSPQDWIELHNTTGSTIDITGWFLSDDNDNFKRYQIGVSAPVTIDPNGYVVFTQNDHFGNYLDPGSDVQFGLSELGETVYLCSGSGGVLTGGFCAKEDFKASEDEVSFGRYTKSAAAGYDVDFVSMASASSGGANGSPKVGPVVITEIMYHPPDPNSYAEYVEIKNISGTTVSLEDWRLTDESGGIEYYIPSGTSLTNGSYLLLVKNEVAFNEVFTPAGGVTILEWVEGRLNNAGEKIQISKPGTPEPSGFVPYIRVDRVNYSDGSHGENFRELNYNDPWPMAPDGTGQALERITDGNYGNDVANWQAAAHSPGS